MLLNKCINLFMTLPIIANLNRMVVMTKMNASALTRVIFMDVEDSSSAQFHALGVSLQILQPRVDPRGGGLLTRKDSFVTPSNSVSLFEEV